MRINPVSVMSYHTNTTHSKQTAPHTSVSRPTVDTVSFQGKTAGLLGIVGTFAGIGLGTLATIATGGLAAPLFLGMTGCAAGCIGGSAIEAKKNPEKYKEDHY